MTTMDDDNRITITDEEGTTFNILIKDADSLAAGIDGDLPVVAVGALPVVAVGDLPVVAAGDLPIVAAMDDAAALEEVSSMEEVPMTEEVPMVVSMDPAMCSFSSVFMSADETVVSGSPPPSAAVVPVPVSLVPEKEEEEEEEINVKGKRVAGRRQAVVDDDGESQSSMSAASVDVDTSLASSSGIKRKGFKRGRRAMKDADLVDKRKTDSGSSVERRKRRKGKKEGNEGKKREVKASPEEEANNEKCEESKGIIEQALEDLSSSVLGAAITDWADKIDEIWAKSKNLQGKLNGEIKRCVTKIKDGTTLLVIRSEASGDPHFLRLRNAELTSQLLEAERENARLKEQLRRSSPKASPPRKRRSQRLAMVSDSADGAPVDSAASKAPGVFPSSIREAFPPLPQRSPRGKSVVAKGGGDRATPVAGISSVIPSGSVDVESGMEIYYTQRINALVAARDIAMEKRRNVQPRKELVRSQEKKDENKDGNRGSTPKDGGSKVGPRILSDIQIAPPLFERPKEGILSPAMSELDAEWKTALGRRRGGRGKPLRPSQLSMPPPFSPRDRDTDVAVASAATERPLARQPTTPRVRPPRPPASSAVTITGRAEGFSYASALKSAREHIDLKTLGIQTTRVRKAINGGLLIEVSGEDSLAKAKELVARLQGVLMDSAVVSCPVKKRELRIIGFDESVTLEEITEVLSETGQCSASDIKVGPIRFMRNGLGMVWAQLPVAAAVRVVEVGRIRIGWTMARVELLKARPLQCFRCWAFGHIQSTCRSIVDRRGACFRCGQKGHMASACGNEVSCAVCHDAGLEASHRLGGPQCFAQTQQEFRVADRRTQVTARSDV